MINSYFQCSFDTIIRQGFYLRPQTDEDLLAFLYGKKSTKINISIEYDSVVS